jgi:hypothetical protein
MKFKLKVVVLSEMGMLAHVYNPSYFCGKQENCSSRLAYAKLVQDPILKKKLKTKRTGVWLKR